MFNRRTSTILAMFGGLALAGFAQAQTFEITGQGAPIPMSSGSMSGLFGGPSDHDFSDAALEPIHHMLHDDGIVTDGMVTFLFLDTDDGMSFLALVDDPTLELMPGATELNMTSTGPNSANFWINDLGDLDLTAEAEGETTVLASFRWNDGRGDAFAWSDLESGDSVGFSFSPRGEGTALSGETPYQFVSRGESGWESVRFGSYSEGEFDFQFTLPAPGALALLSLAGVLGSPRRRRA